MRSAVCASRNGLLRCAAQAALALILFGSSASNHAEGRASGAVLVLNKSEATASLLHSENGAVLAKMATGEGPHEVAVSANGESAVVTNYGQEVPGNSLTVIDLRNRRSSRNIDLGKYQRPHGVAWLPDGRRVLVTVEANKAVLIVDVAQGTIEGKIDTGQDVSHMVVASPDGRHAWVANIGSGSVTRLDVQERAVVRTVATGAGAEGLDVSPDGREIWVTNRGDNTITVLDAVTLKQKAQLASSDFPIRVKLTPDGKFALVTNARSAQLRIFDVADRRLQATVEFPTEAARAKPTVLGKRFGGSAVPIGILVAPDGRRAWVALAGTDEIAVVDLRRRVVEGYWRAGREPDGLGYVPAAVSSGAPPE